jgi:phage gpG-like protein
MEIRIETNYRLTVQQFKYLKDQYNKAVQKGLTDAANIGVRAIKHNLDNVILHRITSGLYDSIVPTTIEQNQSNYIISIITDPDKPWAWIHEVGGNAGRNHAAHIPARHPYTLALEVVKAQIQKAIDDPILRVVSQNV